MPSLDYSLKTPEERIECVKKVLANTPDERLRPQYLNYMSDYILFVADRNQTKKEKKEERGIITKNREVTVNKRQVSFEQIISDLENGEDGIYALITNDKNQIMDHKNPLTKKDIEEVPGLKEHIETINRLKEQFRTATGQRKYSLKKQIIETWQQIYILKASFRGSPIKGRTSNQVKSMAKMPLDEKITLDENQMPTTNAKISLIVPSHVSFLLCYYSQLKQECDEDLSSDMHWLLIDLENLVDRTFKNNDILYDLLIWKIDGLTNEEIQRQMESTHGVIHNEQYYSTLWRKRIPKMIAEKAQMEWLEWYFMNVEKGNWKYCNKCGEYKLAHPMFFSKNTSKDGFYSICKECRSKINNYN